MLEGDNGQGFGVDPIDSFSYSEPQGSNSEVNRLDSAQENFQDPTAHSSKQSPVEDAGHAHAGDKQANDDGTNERSPKPKFAALDLEGEESIHGPSDTKLPDLTPSRDSELDKAYVSMLIDEESSSESFPRDARDASPASDDALTASRPPSPFGDDMLNTYYPCHPAIPAEIKAELDFLREEQSKYLQLQKQHFELRASVMDCENGKNQTTEEVGCLSQKDEVFSGLVLDERAKRSRSPASDLVSFSRILRLYLKSESMPS